MTDKFYDLPSTISKRSAGIGIGQRKMLSQGKFTVSPNKYGLIGQIEQNLKKKKGYTFGIRMNLFDKDNTKSPGPGNYNIPSTLSKIGKRIVQTSKSNGKIQHLNVPGPGTYNINTTKSNGQYILSNYKTDRYTLIQNSHIDRDIINKGIKDFPGPGNYNFNLKILSSKKNITNISFPKQIRPSMQKKGSIPGPGAYIIPSMFKKKK